MMLDLRRLQLLHRFSVCGSIAATAVSLGYSPSAVSQQLSALEHQTGAVLLERTARSASLTAAGRLLADRAADILTATEAAETELAAQRGSLRGALVVSTVPSLATTVAAGLVEVQRPHPELDLVMNQVAAEQAPDAVLAHLSDLAIVDDWRPRPPGPAVGLARRPIATEPVVLAVPVGHPLALAARSRPLGGRELAHAVAELIWLCAPPGNASRTAGDRRLDDVGAVPLRLWEFEGLATLAELVAGGAGCAFLPASVVNAQPPGQISSIELAPRWRRHVYGISRTSAAASPAIGRCLDAVTARLRRPQAGPAA